MLLPPRPARARAGFLALLALVAGCAGPADPRPESQEGLRAAAAPLLQAHAQLDTYDQAVQEGDHEQARALWPEVAAAVGAAVDAFDPATSGELDPAQRSALIGYAGGLRTALLLWEQVEAAIRADPAGPAAEVDDRARPARDHMRFLDRLRSRALGGGLPEA
ncbi:hypothetical protein BH23ACT9_BH23ACT9_33750 [soil metagenome]